ncbi:MAG: flagellar hook-length control protein FliK [Pseudolabrys sp.]
MPSVASDPPAPKPAAPPAPKPAAAERAPATPFQALLDSPEPAAPPPRKDPPPAKHAEQSPPPRDDRKSADSAKQATDKHATDKNNAKAAGKDSPPQADQTPAQAETGKTAGGVKTKTDANTTQAAGDALKQTAKHAKDKSAGAAKGKDGKKDPASADGAVDANGVVAAVVTPTVAPATLGPAKPTKGAGIDADGAAKGQKNALAALPAGDTKAADGAKADDKVGDKAGDQTSDAAGKPQANSDGKSDNKPQSAGDSGKQSAAHPAGPAPDKAHQADAHDGKAQPQSGAQAAPKADAAPPQVTPPTQQNAPSSTPAPAPTAQPLPQAAPVPLSGVAIDIAGKALAGKNRFEIRLDPPELGRVEVHLDVDKDGRITSHVIADRKDTLNLLQRDASGLQRALQDAGLKTADNGLQFSLRDQSGGQQQNSGGSASSGARLVVEDDSLAPIDAAAGGYGRILRLDGGLDIRV